MDTFGGFLPNGAVLIGEEDQTEIPIWCLMSPQDDLRSPKFYQDKFPTVLGGTHLATTLDMALQILSDNRYSKDKKAIPMAQLFARKGWNHRV